MKLENAWPGVFPCYLKCLWAVTFLCMLLTSTGPDKYRFLRAGRGARDIPAAAALRCPIHLSMPRAVVQPLPLLVHELLHPLGVARAQRAQLENLVN